MSSSCCVELSDLIIYPVKSLPGIRVRRALVTPLGLVDVENRQIRDRKWMIIDENGSFRTQRQLPKMALIDVTTTNNDLVFAYPNKGSIQVPISIPKLKRLKCRVWGLDVDGYAYGGRVAQWLSDVLEKPGLDLVGFEVGDLTPRNIVAMAGTGGRPRNDDETIYADYSPFMLIGEASLDELNRHLKPVDLTVSMRNFRPNFVVNASAPFDEDEWNGFKIGDACFYRIKHCTRCLLTTVDPNSGEKHPKQEPLETLKKFRSNIEPYGVKPILGINLVLATAAANESDDKEIVITVGDKIVLDK